MTNQHRYHKKKYNKKRPHSNRKKRSSFPRMKPAVDNGLKPVLDQIGVPEPIPFTPDPFQVEAVRAIAETDCLVTAPTGSGKTWIAEQAIESALHQGKSVWYGTPLKALTNTIYTRFSEVFGVNNVGILTGDIKENSNAPVIVGTTEIFRNQLYDSMHRGEDLKTDLVILDEAHFLGDAERGVVWEEIMIYLPQRIPLLLLSATVGNAGQIADWLSSIRNVECRIVEETKRSVPLHTLFLHPSGKLSRLAVKKKGAKKASLHKTVNDYLAAGSRPAMAPPGKLPPVGDIMKVLKRFSLLPAIFFMKSRADCDSALDLYSRYPLQQDEAITEKRKARIEALLKNNLHISNHKQRFELEHYGIGSHHSGQLPAWKIVVETLMSEGLLNAIFATSTVAAGVNFPARTVVILNSDRFNGVEFLPLTATEYSQMTGRAGRRGMDNIGFALALPGRFMNLRLMGRLVNTPPLPVLSQIRINFSMVLNLLMSNSPEQIKSLLDKSFAAWLMAKKRGSSDKKKFFDINGENNYLWQDFLLHLDFLKTEGFVDEENQLTEDGIWAARLRIDSPLLVAEGFRLNLFPKNDPALLAAIIAAFVNEKEYTDRSSDRRKAPKQLLTTFLKVKRLLTPFAYHMLDSGFNVSPLFLQPATTLFNWASGVEWEDVSLESGLAEGDLSRLILRTADNLQHIANLKEHFPETAASAKQAKEIIMREPVVTFFNT